MRNLKKALSLVLALVFVLGLCTIGAGAAFTDEADIQYKEAITVLNGLGILEGYGDGKFGPLDNLTREQAAKMIAYMMLGEANAEKLINKQVFDDVAATRWSAKYIYFCYQKGIINGYGDGNFGPADNVTGTQLAKMLLCAVGYGCMGEYTGEGWDVNVFIDAVSEGIFEDAKTADYSAIATREEAALYVFNTLTGVDQVAYDVDLNKYDSDEKYGGTFAEDVWNLVGTAEDEEVHVVAKNQATGADYTVIDNVNYAIETGLDLIGHDVNIYFKADPKKGAEGETYYEAYLVEDVSTVVSASAYFGDLYKILVENVENKDVAFDEITRWTNYVETDENLTDAIAASAFAPSSFDGLDDIADLKGNYTTQTYLYGSFVLSEEGAILCYTDVDYTVDRVSAIDEDGILLKNDTFDVEYYDADLAYEGIAKGDYVTVQPVGDLYYLYPTSTKTVTIFERSAYNDALWGGMFGYNFNYYGVMSGAGYGDVTVENSIAAASIIVGDVVTFYMDAYGSFFAAVLEERGTSDGYVFVVYNYEQEDAVYANSTSPAVQAVDAEGKEVHYVVDEEYHNADIAQGVYQVFLNDKNEAHFVGADTNDAIDSCEKEFKGQGKDSTLKAGQYLTDDVVIHYVNDQGKDLEVETASIFAEGEYIAYYYIYSVSTTADEVAVVWVYDEAAPLAYADSYVYVTESFGGAFGPYALPGGTMDIAGETEYYYTVYINGVSTTAFIGASHDVATPQYFVNPGFYQYSVDENGIYTLKAVAGGHDVTLGAGQDCNIRNGKFTAPDCDNVDITGITVCNLSAAEENGRYIKCDTLEDLQGLLAEGYVVEVSYLAIENADDDMVPFGALYVQSITPPGI